MLYFIWQPHFCPPLIRSPRWSQSDVSEAKILSCHLPAEKCSTITHCSYDKNQNSPRSLGGPVEVSTFSLPHGPLLTARSHQPRAAFLVLYTLRLLPPPHQPVFTLEFSLNCDFLGEVFPGFQTRSSPIFTAFRGPKFLSFTALSVVVILHLFE